jgi:hypothetical protein
MRKRIQIEIVSNESRVQKLLNKTMFKYATFYSENLSVITLEIKFIGFCTPIYIGINIHNIIHFL